MIRALVQSVAGYPGLFLFCVVSGVILPVPEDLSLVYAGMRIREGEWSWMGTLSVAMTGVFLRDIIAFGIGRWVGEYVFTHDWALTLLGGRARLERAQNLVRVHEASSVLIGRFFVGMRAPIFFVAGAMGVSKRRFVAWDLLGLAVAVPGMVVIGYVFGEPVAEGMAILFKRTREVTVLLCVAIGLWLAWRFSRTRNDRAA